MLRGLAGLVFIVGSTAFAAVGDAWVTKNAVPTSEPLRGLVHTGSNFIAVGKHGAAFTSAAGTTWSQSHSGTQSNLNAVAWSGSLAVAAGDNGTVVTSATGTVWGQQTSPLASNWRGITWTGSRFIIVGDAGAVATSLDGTTWSHRYIGSVTDLRNITTANSVSVAIGGQGFIARTSDGVAWTTLVPVTTATLRSIAGSPSMWVAVGDNGTILSSADSVTWSTSTSGVTMDLNGVAWDGTRFIAAGVDGAVLTSTNGTAWTLGSTGSTEELLSAAFGNGLILLAGDHGVAITSSDGSAWTVQSNGVRRTLYDAVNSTSLWAAAGTAGTIATSVDGNTWTAQSSGTTFTLRGIGWNGAKYAAVGDNGTVLRSTDGLAWTASSAITTRSLQAVAGSPTQWVAVGENGVVLASADGATWTSVTSGTANSLRSVVWADTMFVAVGDGGTVITSTNGTSWTVRTSGTAARLNSVSWSGSLLTAVGSNGVIVTSANAANWTLHSLAVTNVQFSALTSVTWDGVELVAVGYHGSALDPSGWVLISSDGVTWVERPIDSAPSLYAVCAGGGQVILAGLGGTVLMDATSPPPELNFVLPSSTFAENAGVVQVRVTLSALSLVPVKVFFSAAGVSAVVSATGDASVSASPVIIPAGQVSAPILVTLKDDISDENDETLMLTITSVVGASLGAGSTHLLTIADNDTEPTFMTQPQNRIVATGTSLTMSSVVAGDAPLLFQWTRNNVNISGATNSTYLISAANLTHGGTYRLKASNKSGNPISDSAELVVVDTTPKSWGVVFNKAVTFTVGSSGNGLSYQWFKEGVGDVIDDPSPAKRIVGAKKNVLTIKALGTGDSGVYRCKVTSPIGSLDGGANTLTTIIPPVVHAPSFGSLMVSQYLNVQVPSENGPTKFVISNLPLGLTYNAATGFITGRPLVASGALPFNILISASNAAGTSGPPLSVPLVIAALTPNCAGAFFGLIDRESNVNASLGGRIQFLVTKTGGVTGSLVNGKLASAFIKALDSSVAANPNITASVKRTGKSNLEINGTLDPISGVVVGTVSDTTGSSAFHAWRSMPAPFTGYPGYYTAALKLSNALDEGQENIPQGYGATAFIISSAGIASGALRTADASVVTFSSGLRNTGKLALFNLLYGSTGSVHGQYTLTLGSPAIVGSDSLTWYKAPQAIATRSYKAGFAPLALTAFGSRYTAPTSGAFALGLNPSADNISNASLTFAEGGAPDPATRLNILFRLVPPATRDPQTPLVNPGKVTVSVNHLTGGINGGFSLVDTDTTVLPNKPITRSLAYTGVIARDTDGVLKGFGCFQLPQMPQNAVPPTTTIGTSPILSGRLRLGVSP